MIFIDIEMPSRCADCPCYRTSWGDGEYTHGSDGCELLKITFNEYVFYGKKIHNPFKERYKDCPLKAEGEDE